MTQTLPAGLVTTTGRTSSGLGGSSDINVEDIATLWKVYTAQSSVLRDRAASRLENLFWRIWGNVRVRRTLTGPTLATLFMAILEDKPTLLTARSSPPSVPKKTSDVPTKSLNSPTLSTPSVSNHSNAGNLSFMPSAQARAPLPPILKKPNADRSGLTSESSSLKTTRILVPEPQSQRIRTILTPATGAPAIETSASGDAVQKQSRKRPAFVANTPTSTRRKNVPVRRKSSQTSSGTEVSEDSLFPPEVAATDSPSDKNSGKEEAPVQKAEVLKDPDSTNISQFSWQSLPYLHPTSSNNRTTFSSIATSRSSPPPTGFSASSVHRYRSPDGPSSPSAEHGIQPSTLTTSLVDRDFRTRFAERQRQEAGSDSGSVSSSLIANQSSSYLKSLMTATSDGDSGNADGSEQPQREPSPTRRILIMPKRGPGPVPPQMFTSRKSSRSRAYGPVEKTSRGREQNSNTITKRSQSRSRMAGRQPPPVHIPAASTSVTSQQTSSGVFSVPKLQSNPLSKMAERSKQTS